MKSTNETSGVQELIDKLKNLGVGQGQREAEQLLKEAHNEASRILCEAQKQADKLLAEGRKKLEVEKKSSHEAIKTAFRDTELALRSHVRQAFSAHLKRLVSLELQDKEFIKQLVLVIARKNAAEIDQSSQMELLLPAKIFEIEENELSEEGKKSMRHLVLGITEDMLRKGIELKAATDVKGGIKVRLVGKDIELDLTDDSITDLLLKYLLPHYREIVAGGQGQGQK